MKIAIIVAMSKELNLLLPLIDEINETNTALTELGNLYDKLSNLSYTQRLAQEWINVIQNGYTDSKGKKHDGYGTENQPYWASVNSVKKYNQIYS